MRSRLVLGVAALLSVAITSGAHSATYTLTVLDSLQGGTGSEATGINNSGQVVGYSASPGNDTAVIWNGTTPTALGNLSNATSCCAFGINNTGQAAGFASTTNGTQAAIWNGTAPTALGTPSGTNSYAYSINSAGQVVGGFQAVGDYTHTQAVIWNGTAPTVLNALGRNYATASGINNAGVAVGTLTTAAGFQTAVVWNGNAPTLLGELVNQGAAFAINNIGQVVGLSNLTANTSHAVIWNGITPTDLGSLGGNSQANAINDAGQVVGFSYTNNFAAQYAVLWDGTTPIDLNTLLDSTNTGWTLADATGINLQGQIVGTELNALGQGRAFLLTPDVPEPSTWAMLLLGFAGIGFMAYRQKSIRLLTPLLIALLSISASRGLHASQIVFSSINDLTVNPGGPGGNLLTYGFYSGSGCAPNCQNGDFEPIDKFTLGTASTINSFNLVIHPDFPDWHTGIDFEIYNADHSSLLYSIPVLPSLLAGNPSGTAIITASFPTISLPSGNFWAGFYAGYMVVEAFPGLGNGSLIVSKAHTGEEINQGSVVDMNLGYQLLSSSVPEPSTWAMMLIGFAGIGFMAYGGGRRLRAA